MINGPRDTVKRARELRSEMSLPEMMLWRELRKRPGGHKFRRQHPAGDFVLDFYCAKARLDIEVDGWVHDSAPLPSGIATALRLCVHKGLPPRASRRSGCLRIWIQW